jgi:dTDP-4-dehydrorhamnose 3,5-epimerase
VNYKVDNPYSVKHDSGLLCRDKTIGIDWKISDNDLIISKKDKLLKTLVDL